VQGRRRRRRKIVVVDAWGWMQRPDCRLFIYAGIFFSFLK